nr:receptor-type tyrosine-protein phosphatase epsilon isoform X1 [Crassostrea gigas]
MYSAWVLWTLNTFIVILGLDDLSANRNAAQYKIILSCPKCVANHAVDKNKTTCTKTDMGPTSDVPYTWWNVDLGAVHSVHNIRIQFRDYGHMYVERQRGRFAGFSLYVSNTTDRNRGYLCYKNGQELPLLDFNTNCSVHGRYVIFYNERLNGTRYPPEYEPANIITELCEVTVTGCYALHVYGCQKPCPVNCEESRCDAANGTCIGCEPGWIGEYCQTACPAGYYGLKCESECVGVCKDKEPCNHTNGLCDKGCDDGWTGTNCTEACPPNSYGPNCIFTCGHCSDDIPCNRTTGNCDRGCKPGYTGKFCDTGCKHGKFGTDCSNHCSGNCLFKNTCNPTNGHCDNGCDSGYLEEFCNKPCDKRQYGLDCIQNCSADCMDGLCNNVNGHCNCTYGKKGSPYCNESCSEGSYGMDCGYNCSKGCKNGSCETRDGNCTSGCKSSYEGPKCDKKKDQATLNIGAVIGAVGASVILLVVAVILFYLLRQRRNKSKKSDEREMMGFSAMDETLIKNKRKPANKTGIQHDNFESETKKRSKRLTTKDSQNAKGLTKYLTEIKNTKMEEEYKAIPKGELHSCIEGKRQENKSKNRYTTIFPYDHSRVVLHTSTTESDYINANYIEDVFGKKKYIATQGPKDRTITDFWRMVWQENARIIVCLTNISEAKTKKCAKYWPDLNDKHMEGDISVRCQKEQTYAENVVRHLRIKNNSENTERDVFMFHYTQWPDHGVPEPLSLVVFHRHVMKTVEDHPLGYIVVHCSAGVGRTGTFIALDALYKEGEITGKVNVPQYVEKMRNDRMNMIQGEDQYKTVYMALLEAFRGRLRAVPVDFFLKEFQDHSCYLNHGDVSKISPFAVEFEELLSFRKVYTHEDYISGMSNISANYVPSVLPVERYLCPLTTENLYYNAVCLQSFTRCDRFISAQFPLPDYTEHFLTLVKTYYTCTIVSLYPLGDVKSTSLWLPTKSQQKTVGPFTIKMAESTQAKYVTKTNITLQEKEGSSMRVAVLECKGWEDEYDSKSRRILIDLVQEAKIEERTHPTGRILVLSSDGAKRCGPFCAVFNALEQMMMDEEVDLFTITRQLQTRRPEFLSSLEEYQFCFDTISDYLQNDNLYANV